MSTRTLEFSKPKTVRVLSATVLIMLACMFGMYITAFAEGETQEPAADTLEAENGVPLMILYVNESTATIDQMNESDEHSVECKSGSVEFKVPEGYKPTEGYSSEVPSGEMEMKYVRGRGNSTWKCDKKPYKVELMQAQNLFGMGASTDWGLLANSYDKTLMRNRITFWLGEKLGMDFTPQQIPVDLVMVGSKTGVHKYGTYCLCETIKVEPSRINIDKLKKNDSENVTGGYLLATYFSQEGQTVPESTRFMTKHGVEFMNDKPEYEGTLTEAQQKQREYIIGYMQEVEDLIMNAEMEDGKITAKAHDLIAEKMDLKSAADYWLMQEIPFNTDGYATTSTYLYKARDGKLYWGPLWDYDYAWWNNSGPWPESNETFNNTSMLWIDQLRERDPQFAKLVKERWAVLNELLKELTKENGIIDQYKSEVSQSQKADYELWKDHQGKYNNYKGVTEEDYNADIEKMRTWIDTRRAWAENNKSELDHLFCTAIYMVKGKIAATESVRYGEKPVMDPDVQVPEGYVLQGWMNGRNEATDVTMTEDTVFTAVLVEEDKAVKPEKMNMYIDEATVDLSKGFYPAIDGEGLVLDMIAEVEPYGEVTNPRITWSSSNEDVAVIDPVNHRVILKAGGVTTITGKLHNGVSGSFVLHVTPEPVSIEDADVVLSKSGFTYNGKVQKPDISTIGGKALAADTDYTAVWSNAYSKNAGTYTVTITGKGGYTGTTSATYKISKAANPLNIKAKTTTVRYSRLRKKTQTRAVTKAIRFTKKTNDKKTYKLSSAKKGSKSFKKYFRINKTTGKVTVKKGLKKGSYKVKVRVKALGNKNYKASTFKSVTFTVKVK